MNHDRSRASIQRSGLLAFAAGLMGLGILGLATGGFALVWQPVPAWVPGRLALTYACGLASLVSGTGLLWRRTRPWAAVLALLYLLLWWLLLRVPAIVVSPLDSNAWGGVGEGAVMLSGALALYAEFGPRIPGLTALSAGTGTRVARVMLGLSLLACGQSNWYYFSATAHFIPGWIPAHGFWTALTAAAFIAAGLALVFGVFARLAAALITAQMMAFTLLIWLVDVLVAPQRFHWTGLLISWQIAAGAWVVAQSYRAAAINRAVSPPAQA